MAEREALTAAYVRSILDYNPETGVFTWRERPREHFLSDKSWTAFKARFAGEIAGTDNPLGHLEICINGVSYKAHRLAWLIMTGEWPKDFIDHINRRRADNRFANLREATDAQNKRNTGKRRHNKSGIKGVSWNRQRQKWQADIQSDRKRRYLGIFDDIAEAAAAYARAAKELHGEFARV